MIRTYAETTTLIATVALAMGCSTTTSTVAAAPPPTQEASPCRIAGPPQRLAGRAYVPRGVAVLPVANGFEVRFARARSECLTMGWPSSSSAPVPGSCPKDNVDSVTASGITQKTLLAWQSDPPDVRHLEPGTLVPDAPSAPLGLLPRAGDSETGSAVLSLGDDYSLSLWTDGGFERSDLHAQVVTGAGEPVGPPIDVSPPQGTVIGRARAAITADGRGLIVYIAAVDGQFGVFGTPFVCAVP